MKRSIFAPIESLPTHLLAEILSYVPHGNHNPPNKFWHKVSITNLLSRHNSYQDIFNQIQFFKKTISPYLKRDTDFLMDIRRLIFASMNSSFSTPQHKLQGMLFLCKLVKLSDGQVSDDYLSTIYNMYGGNTTPYIFSFIRSAEIFSHMLPQTQIDRLFQSVLPPLNGSEHAEKPKPRALIHPLLECLPGASEPIIEEFFSLAISYLKQALCNHDINQSFAFLKKISRRLKGKQIDIFISETTAILNNEQVLSGYNKSELLKDLKELLEPFIANISSNNAMLIITNIIPLIPDNEFNLYLKEDYIEFITLYAKKLNEEDAFYLIDSILIPDLMNSESSDTDSQSSDPRIMLCIIECLSFEFKPNYAEKIFDKVMSLPFRISNPNFLRRFITKEENFEQIEALIQNDLSNITLEICVNGVSVMPENYIDDRKKGETRWFSYDSKALKQSVYWDSFLTQAHVTTIFNYLDIILSNTSKYAIFSQYSSALDALKELMPRLTSSEKNRAFIILNRILENDGALYDHDVVLQALECFLLQSDKNQVIRLLPRVLSLLDHDRKDPNTRASNLLMLLFPQIKDTELIKQVCDVFEAMDINSFTYVDFQKLVLTFITSLKFRLNENQINLLFGKILPIVKPNVLLLKTLEVVINQLTPENIKAYLLLIFKISYTSQCHSHQESIDIFNFAIRLAPKVKRLQSTELSLISIPGLTLPTGLEWSKVMKKLGLHFYNSQLTLEKNIPTVIKVSNRYFVYGKKEDWEITELDANEMYHVDFQENKPNPSDLTRIWKQIELKGAHISCELWVFWKIISMLKQHPNNDRDSTLFSSGLAALHLYADILTDDQIDAFFLNLRSNLTHKYVLASQILAHRLKKNEQINSAFTSLISALQASYQALEDDVDEQRSSADQTAIALLHALSVFAPQLNPEQVQILWENVRPFFKFLEASHKLWSAFLLLHTLGWNNKLDFNTLIDEQIKLIEQNSPTHDPIPIRLLEALMVLEIMKKVKNGLIKQTSLVQQALEVTSESTFAP